MLDRIEFLLGEAFAALRRNGLMTMAAISTAAMALFLLGGLGYVYYHATKYGSRVAGQYEMRVFLREGTTVEAIKQTAKEMRGIAGVKQVVWIPKDIAWQKFKQEHPASTEGFDVGNPLPDGFKVILADVALDDEVAAKIQAMPVVEPKGVQRLELAADMMANMLAITKWVGGVLGSLMLITAGVLIYNAIRLTVIARRREIRIMQLVGAAHGTVKTPFVIEGMVQGSIGGCLATLLIFLCNSGLDRFINNNLPNATNLPDFPLWTTMGILALAGAVFGIICSSIAVREPLKFRPKAVQQ